MILINIIKDNNRINFHLNNNDINNNYYNNYKNFYNEYNNNNRNKKLFYPLIKIIVIINKRAL